MTPERRWPPPDGPRYRPPPMLSRVREAVADLAHIALWVLAVVAASVLTAWLLSVLLPLDL